MGEFKFTTGETAARVAEPLREQGAQETADAVKNTLPGNASAEEKSTIDSEISPAPQKSAKPAAKPAASDSPNGEKPTAASRSATPKKPATARQAAAPKKPATASRATAPKSGGSLTLLNFLAELPIAIAVTIAFLLWGFLWDGFYASWTLFLLIPIFHSLIKAVSERNVSRFAYPVLIVFVYCLIGVLWGAWHPYWILFLTIPIFYTVADKLKAK